MIEALQSAFGIPDAVTVIEGTNGLPKVVATHRSGAKAEVYLHGAHVTSWMTPGGDELFFVSQASNFAPELPIRGGIPVVFPQFSMTGPLPQHGLARTRPWELARTAVLESGEVLVALRLTESLDTLAMWPHSFVLELALRLDETALTVGLQATNTGDAPFPFHAVFHTYFRVADIRQTGVRGLEGADYLDALRDRARETETRAVIDFAGETDRIYLNVPAHLQVEDGGHGRVIALDSHGMPDAVVWNPWVDKAKRMPDFGDEEYREMVCVETGIIAEQRELAPQARWEGETRFSYRPY